MSRGNTTVAKHFRRQSVKTGTPTTRNNAINDPTNIKNKRIFSKHCAIKIFSYLQCVNLHIYGHRRGETTSMIYLKAFDHSSAKRTTTPHKMLREQTEWNGCTWMSMTSSEEIECFRNRFEGLCRSRRLTNCNLNLNVSYWRITVTIYFFNSNWMFWFQLFPNCKVPNQNR